MAALIDGFMLLNIEHAILDQMANSGLRSDEKIGHSLNLPGQTVGFVRARLRSRLSTKVPERYRGIWEREEQALLEWYLRVATMGQIYSNAPFELCQRLKKCGMIFNELINLDMLIGESIEQLLPALLISLEEEDIDSLVRHSHDQVEQRLLIIDTLLRKRTGSSLAFWQAQYADYVAHGILASWLGRFPELLLYMLEDSKRLPVSEKTREHYKTIISEGQKHPVMQRLLQVAKILDIPFTTPPERERNRLESFRAGYKAGKTAADVGNLIRTIVGNL